MLGRDYEGQDCTLARALEVVGERWTLLILRDAFYGVERFSDFAAHLDIPRAVLADRLSGLTEHGLLERRPDPSHRGREIYLLTRSGRELWPALHALMRFGDRFVTTPNAALRFVHAECGTRLDTVGHCPRCDSTPPAEDVATKPSRTKPARDDRVSVSLTRPIRLLQSLELS